MSAPLSGPASGSPTPGYYPDPSIPGYIRYWNGDAWVPGTSRPEPRDGDPVPAPPPEAASASATSPPTTAEPAPAEETGTFRAQGPSGTAGSGTVWQADAARQSGTGEGTGTPLSWGHGAQRDTAEGEPSGRGAGSVPEGTVQMRAMKPGGPTPPAEDGGSAGGLPEHTVGLRRSDLPRQAGLRPEQPAPGRRPVQPLPGQSPAPADQPGQEAAPPSWAAQAHFPAQQSPAQQLSGGQPGAAQSQAAGPESVIPWRPPVSDPFLAAAQQQARPAGLGKRLGARAVDGVITSAVVGAAAFPLVNSGVEHIEQKIEAVRQSGETEQVWLIDGTTGGHLAVVLAVLLLFGLVYEVLPTARWGRTLGKKLFGLQVLDVEQQSTPGFGPSAVRWLAQHGLWLLVVGVVNVVWALFDRPWHQCWHDKAAHTFVAKEETGVSL